MPQYQRDRDLCMRCVFICQECTVVTCPPARWFATALAMDGFSATHSTRFTRATGIVGEVLLIAHGLAYEVSSHRETVNLFHQPIHLIR